MDQTDIRLSAMELLAGDFGDHPRTNNYNEVKNRANKRRHLRNNPTLSQCVLLDRLDKHRTHDRYHMWVCTFRHGSSPGF